MKKKGDETKVGKIKLWREEKYVSQIHHHTVSPPQ